MLETSFTLEKVSLCAPVWCRSYLPYRPRLFGAAVLTPASSTINDALRIVTGCLRLTPAHNLPILAGIQPAELRREGATLSLARRAMEPGDLLHSAPPCPSSANAKRLKSRHPFVSAAQQLISLSDNNNIREAQWSDSQWNAEWADNPTRLRISSPTPGNTPMRVRRLGPTQLPPHWCRLFPQLLVQTGYGLLCGL